MPHRFATLAAALLAAPVLAQTGGADSTERTTIDAQRIEAVGDLEVSAWGAAEIRRDDLTIFGEHLHYNRELGFAEGDGGVRLQSGVDRFFGPRLEYNTRDDTGVFESPAYLLQRGHTARGGAESMEFLGKDRYLLKDATFTTCEPGREDWRLEASELELDYEEGVGYATSPRLRFFDVPILAAPFATFPLEDRRKSGVLSPYYAQTSSRGFEFGIPYYWNIAPEYDLTLTPVYMAKRGFQLKNHGRYLGRMYEGEARLEYLPEDRELGGASRTGLSLQHQQTLAAGLTFQGNYNEVSDDRYLVDLSSQVRQVSQRNLPQDASLTYARTIAGAPYVVQAHVQRFQTLQDPLDPIVPPYQRLPQLRFATTQSDIGGLFDASIPAEYVQFYHPTLLEGARQSATPAITLPVLAPGWFLQPKLGAHYAGYSLEAFDGMPARSPSMSVPFASIDSGLVFERDARWFGETLTQTLEPRLFYVYVPYRNQDEIPVFDTALADFNYTQLFTENRFVGGDRFGDANQLTLALTSRFLWAGGQEAFRATIGQRYYFEDERVGLTPASPLRTASESDILAAVGGRLFRYWTFDAGTQYNRSEQRMERYTVTTRYSPELAKVINASYRFNRLENIRQIDVSAQWPIAPGWYGVGRYNYSLLDDRLLEGIAGVEYNAGCWVFRIVVQRVQAASAIASSTLAFQLEFNGVGQIGTDEVVELLKRNVPGYSVTNPAEATLAPPSTRARLPFEQVY
ncbi:MAG TPA: LPS-assembly protein LptD [Burkholderiales bacterium]|nr:LPS-assembly protein LptD [Burkholderiales bacterium]